MADAEVPLVFPSTANRNRVEQLGREARRPRERRTVEQCSDRGSFSAASSPLQPRPPQPTQAPSASRLLQGLLREGGPVSDFDPIREMKELVQEIKQSLHSISPACLTSPFLPLERETAVMSAFSSTAWRALAASLCPTVSQPQPEGRPSLPLSLSLFFPSFHLTGIINNPGSWCFQLRTKSYKVCLELSATPCRGHFFVFFSCFSSLPALAVSLFRLEKSRLPIKCSGSLAGSP